MSEIPAEYIDVWRDTPYPRPKEPKKLKSSDPLYGWEVKHIIALYEDHVESLGSWQELSEEQQRYVCDTFVDDLIRKMEYIDEEDMMSDIVYEMEKKSNIEVVAEESKTPPNPYY